MQFLETDTVARARNEDLLRAARHYRRAISALRETTFESLNHVTADKLRAHLEQEMQTVAAELGRRGIPLDDAGPVMHPSPEPVRRTLAPVT